MQSQIEMCVGWIALSTELDTIHRRGPNTGEILQLESKYGRSLRGFLAILWKGFIYSRLETRTKEFFAICEYVGVKTKMRNESKTVGCYMKKSIATPLTIYDY